MHRLVYRHLNRCDAVLDRLLHLLEGTRFDLAHALFRHAELVGQLRECDRVFRQAPHLEDAPVPPLEHAKRIGQDLAAVIVLVARGERRFLVLGYVPPASPAIRPESPPSRMVSLSEASPPSRRFMSITSCSVTPRRLAMSLT